MLLCSKHLDFTLEYNWNCQKLYKVYTGSKSSSKYREGEKNTHIKMRCLENAGETCQACVRDPPGSLADSYVRAEEESVGG